MTFYTYSARAPGSSKAKIPVRGADSGLTLANAIALYQRPVLIHAGPMPMRMGEARNIPYPWPWVRLDTASGVPTRLDEATFYPTRSRGTIDVSMRLLGLYQMVGLTGRPVEPDEDPAQHVTKAPVLITVDLCQYTSGTTPTVIATTTLGVSVSCYPNYKTPWYPLLSMLSLGTNDQAAGGYDKNLINLGNGGVLRTGQMYPADVGLLQRVRISLPFEAADWVPNYSTAQDRPVFVRVTCVVDPANSFIYDPLASTNPEHFRIFNVASEMRLRGRV